MKVTLYIHLRHETGTMFIANDDWSWAPGYTLIDTKIIDVPTYPQFMDAASAAWARAKAGDRSVVYRRGNVWYVRPSQDGLSLTLAVDR